MSEITNPLGDASSTPTRPRTAPGIGAFYKELLEEGVPADLAYEIVRDAASVLTARDGICVKTPASSAPDEVTA